MTSRLTFRLQELSEDERTGFPSAVVPVVDGVSLVERVTGFETARGYEPAGGYDGIVPGSFRFGDLSTYYLGQQGAEQWPPPGRAWLLGCSCGEVCCWPLEAEVVADARRVVWQDFRQPHRSGRDYTGLGPFTYHRPAYDAAVQAAVASLER